MYFIMQNISRSLKEAFDSLPSRLWAQDFYEVIGDDAEG